MNKFMLALIALGACISASAFALSGPYPSTILKNQFGETSINSVIGGSNVSAQFTVNSTNANGFGVSGLTSTGVASLYMHTSSTPATGNPNPSAGVIVINLTNDYSSFVNGDYAFIAGPAGTPTPVTSPLVPFAPYIITAVGTTTAAGFQSLGMLTGITPAIGVPFIVPSPAPSSVGTGTVAPPAISGITSVELLGVPSPTVSGTPGAQIMLRALAPTSSSVTTLVATAPVDGTVVTLHLNFKALPSQLH